MFAEVEKGNIPQVSISKCKAWMIFFIATLFMKYWEFMHVECLIMDYYRLKLFFF